MGRQLGLDRKDRKARGYVVGIIGCEVEIKMNYENKSGRAALAFFVRWCRTETRFEPSFFT